MKALPRSVIIKLSGCALLVIDRERFLDASKWPTYVSLSDWFFKATQQSSDPSSDHQSAAHQNQDRDGTSQNDMDQTIIEEYLCNNNGLNSNSNVNGV